MLYSFKVKMFGFGSREIKKIIYRATFSGTKRIKNKLSYGKRNTTKLFRRRIFTKSNI